MIAVLLKKEVRYFLLALGFFTRVPVPAFADFREEELNHAAKYFPLVGLLVGSMAALAYQLGVYFLTEPLAVLLSMSATIYLTGAFHEDGLADSADGIGGGWGSERILTIMQDSRIGTYGVVALFFVLFTKFQLLLTLPTSVLPAVLIAAHALSRMGAVYFMATLNYVKPTGKAKPLATEMSGSALMLATLFGLFPFLALIAIQPGLSISSAVWLLLMVLLPVLIAGLWWRNKIKRWIGGYTGDCLGAAQQLMELAFYFGCVLYFVTGVRF